MNNGSFWGALVIICAAWATFHFGDARCDESCHDGGAHATEAHGHSHADHAGEDHSHDGDHGDSHGH